MPTNICAYNVFVSSSKGFDVERIKLRESLIAHNDADALARKCMFVPVAWEVALEKVRLPRHMIEDQIREADKFVLLLSDAEDLADDSGKDGIVMAEVDYLTAMNCFRDPTCSLTEVIVFCKINHSERNGQLLERPVVSSLRQKIDAENSIIFESFDSAAAFSEKLQRHLARWTREHEQASLQLAPHTLRHHKAVKKCESIGGDMGLALPNEELCTDSFTIYIQNMYQSGSIPEKEKKLIQEILSRKTAQSYYYYGIYLKGLKRLSDAERTFKELSKNSESISEFFWVGKAEACLGSIYRELSRSTESQAALERAIEFWKRAGDAKGEMKAYVWLGDLNASFRRYTKAIEAYDSAFSLALENGDRKLLADISFNKARCYASNELIEQAIEAAEFARDIYIELQDDMSLKAIKNWKKAKSIILRAPQKRKRQAV